MSSGQQPSSLLLHEEQRRPEVARKVVLLVLPLRHLARDYHRRLSVEADSHFVQLEGLVPQLPGLVPFEPLVLREQKAVRPNADEVVSQVTPEESSVAAQFGRSPASQRLLQ